MWSIQLSTLLLSFVLTFLSFDAATGYSGGAPNGKGVCTTLKPGHGDKQSGVAPYKLILSSSDDTENPAVGISLRATSQVTFAGFIVQAKNADQLDQIIDGHFIGNDNSQAKTCFSGKDNTLTHRNGQPKTEISATWMPPAMLNATVVFEVTVVQVKKAYWSGIFSDQAYFLAGDLVDSATYGEYLKDLEQNRPKTVVAASQLGNGLHYEQCSDSVCIGLSESQECLASKNCQMLLSAQQSNGENRFTISAKPSEPASKYFSMAFSEDSQMGDDLVVDCLIDSSGAVKMGVSLNVGQTNKLAESDAARDILKDVEVKYVDGVVTCKWRMDDKFQVDKRSVTLAERQYFFLLATGEIESDVGEKNYHDIRVQSSESVNIASVGALESKDMKFLIQIHGALMILAWIGTVSVGILFARFFKDSWPTRLLGGVKVWFAFHRSLMVFSVLAMCVAQACIFYYVGGYRVGAHQVVGSIAFAFALLQPFGALFRPHPDARSRWIFNWAHWFGGNAGQIAAVAAILLATTLKIAGLPGMFFYVILVWILFHVSIHLVLYINHMCSKNSKTHDIALQDLHNNHSGYLETSPSKSSGGAFRILILLVYTLTTAAFCALLIGLIFVPDTIVAHF